MKLDEFFMAVDGDMRCNTSYPISPGYFAKYREFSDCDILKTAQDLSFYIHVPFCKHLCKFCEYTRFLSGDHTRESHYISILSDQIKSYIDSHNTGKLYGLDIGGGTPSALNVENFKLLLELSSILETQATEKVSDFEKSIEISFPTITDQKLDLITEHGFGRISAGIQTVDIKLLKNHCRDNTNSNNIIIIRNRIAEKGITKLNLDLMYGLAGQ